jgi:hypothetical protein
MTPPLSVFWKMTSFSSSSRVHICFFLGKEARLSLIARPSIHSFPIAHSTFTSTLRFCLSLIQPSTFSLFTCECGHGFDASSIDLRSCLFRGQQITTHDAIKNIVYALV